MPLLKLKVRFVPAVIHLSVTTRELVRVIYTDNKESDEGFYFILGRTWIETVHEKIQLSVSQITENMTFTVHTDELTFA